MKVSNTRFSVPFPHPVQRCSKQAMCSSCGSNPCQFPYIQQCMSRHCFWGPVLNTVCVYYKKTPRTWALQLCILFLSCDFITEISIISKIFAGSSPVTRYSTKRQQCWLTPLGVGGRSVWKWKMLHLNRHKLGKKKLRTNDWINRSIKRHCHHCRYLNYIKKKKKSPVLLPSRHKHVYLCLVIKIPKINVYQDMRDITIFWAVLIIIDSLSPSSYFENTNQVLCFSSLLRNIFAQVYEGTPKRCLSRKWQSCLSKSCVWWNVFKWNSAW